MTHWFRQTVTLFALLHCATHCHAQTGISPGPMRAAEAFPISQPLPAIHSNHFITPLPPVDDTPSIKLAEAKETKRAPYGYPSGYPDSISESADAARMLAPPPGVPFDPRATAPVLVNPPIMIDPYGAPCMPAPLPGQAPFIAPPMAPPIAMPLAPPALTDPGIAGPIVQGDQVIIPGELPLECTDGEPPVIAAPATPRGQKNGPLQKIGFLTTYLPKYDDDGLGMVDIENSVMVAFPLPTRDMPLVLTPGFDFHLVDGPDSPSAAGADLPPRLYDLYLQIRWMTKLTERWSLTLATTPGYYTDFEGDHSSALRVTAQALAIWEWQPQSQLIFGLVYLDREDYGFLPAGGLIWTPNEANRLELIFPRPRYLHMFRQTALFEDWWFVGAEFGGGEWAIQRANGIDDVVDITDYRINAGVERKSIDYLVGVRAEIGYVFAREIEYRSGTPSFEPTDTLLVRAGFFY